MDAILLPVIVIILFSFMTLVIVLVLFFRKRHTVLKGLSQDLGARKASGPIGHRYSGTLDGVEYTYHYYPGSRNTPPAFTITVPCESNGELKILKETAFDRFFKKLGVTAEVQTHDQAFDGQFYIETEQPGFARAYLQTPERREEIFKIFDQRFKSLEMAGQLLRLTKSPFSLEHELKDDFVASSVKSLIELSKDLPPEIPDGQTALVRGWSYKAKRSMVIDGAVLVLVCGLALTFWSAFAYVPIDVPGLIRFSLQFSVPAYFLYLFLAFSALRGYARSHKDLLAAVVLGIIAAGTSGYGAAAAYNGYMDAAPASVHRVQVVSKNYSSSRNGTTYYIRVQSWRPGRSTERFSVPWSMYNSVRKGQSSVIVVTKPGALGFEWKVALQKEH